MTSNEKESFHTHNTTSPEKVKITKPEFEKLLNGLTDEELNQVSCWLSARRYKP
jgi:hypothetical protein